MGDDLTNLPRKLKVVGKTWQPDQDVLLFPDFSWCATAVARVAFVCSLELPDFELERYAIELVEPEPLIRTTIIENLAREKSGGPDWLGCYCPEDRLIEIYLSRCDHAARELRIGVQALVWHVLIHESAHFVSHVGIELDTCREEFGHGRTKGRWTPFDRMDETYAEHIAQIASYAFGEIFKQASIVEVMRFIWPYEADIYRTWKDFGDKTGLPPEDILKGLQRQVYEPRYVCRKEDMLDVDCES
jgi:hypothetical protein